MKFDNMRVTEPLVQLYFCLHFLTSAHPLKRLFVDYLPSVGLFSFTTHKLIALCKSTLLISFSKHLPFLRICRDNTRANQLQLLHLFVLHLAVCSNSVFIVQAQIVLQLLLSNLLVGADEDSDVLL